MVRRQGCRRMPAAFRRKLRRRGAERLLAITRDNLMKLFHTQFRLEARIPDMVMGDTVSSASSSGAQVVEVDNRSRAVEGVGLGIEDRIAEGHGHHANHKVSARIA